VDGRPPPGRPRGQSGGKHCTAGQYGYVPLGRHLVFTYKCVPLFHFELRLATFDLSQRDEDNDDDDNDADVCSEYS